MAIQKIRNSFIYALSTDTLPTNYADNTLAYIQDTGDIKRSISGSWSLFRGASKTETYTNKTIDAESNSYDNKLAAQSTFSMGWKKTGSFIPGVLATTGGGSTMGAMRGMKVSVGSGNTAICGVDSTEGIYTPFKTALAGDSVGLLSTSTNGVALVTRYADNSSFSIRCKVDNTTSDRLYIGFTSNISLPDTDTPLGNTDSGVIIGFSSTTANFSVFNNDGTASMITNTMGTGVPKDTNWHTYSIAFSTTNSNVVCTLDGGNTVTLTTRIPSTTTDLYLNVLYGV